MSNEPLSLGVPPSPSLTIIVVFFDQVGNTFSTTSSLAIISQTEDSVAELIVTL